MIQFPLTTTDHWLLPLALALPKKRQRARTNSSSCVAAVSAKPKARLCEPWETMPVLYQRSPRSGRHLSLEGQSFEFRVRTSATASWSGPLLKKNLASDPSVSPTHYSFVHSKLCLTFGRRSAAPTNSLTILTQDSQSLALGLNKSATSQLRRILSATSLMTSDQSRAFSASYARFPVQMFHVWLPAAPSRLALARSISSRAARPVQNDK